VGIPLNLPWEGGLLVGRYWIWHRLWALVDDIVSGGVVGIPLNPPWEGGLFVGRHWIWRRLWALVDDIVSWEIGGDPPKSPFARGTSRWVILDLAETW
jgi:hypothetical protein